MQDKHRHDPDMLAAVGNAALHAGEHGQARAAFEDSLRLRYAPAVQRDLARAYVLLGDQPAALQAIDQAFDGLRRSLEGDEKGEVQAAALAGIESGGPRATD